MLMTMIVAHALHETREFEKLGPHFLELMLRFNGMQLDLSLEDRRLLAQAIFEMMLTPDIVRPLSPYFGIHVSPSEWLPEHFPHH